MNGLGQEVAIIVHGGAWAIPDASKAATEAGCRRAASVGYSVLEAGGSAVDACEAAIRVLENDPMFDAGYGSVLTSAGTVEMDAVLQSGSDLQAGAVACVSCIRNPISLARAIMASDHTLLVGQGAEAYARSLGIETIDPNELVTQAARDELEQLQRYTEATDTLFNLPHTMGHDTVGCCAMDAAGNLAAGTSTGGITAKRPGRVGDSPLLGSGAYCDNARGACSTTGHGESIVKVLLANRVLDGLDHGKSPSDAVAAALTFMKDRVAGCGGAICISPAGKIGASFTTPRMAWAKRCSADEDVVSGIDSCEGLVERP
jgi:beta-aspartyl-peptidase (threonine type)